ncbi:Uncharacterised protein [Vibrio cholerae]|nr:Uncharacterised protein [Vibrio cholerae]
MEVEVTVGIRGRRINLLRVIHVLRYAWDSTQNRSHCR